MFNCVVDQVEFEPVSIGMRVRAKLLAGNGEAPRVYPFDGFRLEFTRMVAGTSSGRQQVLNGVVLETLVLDASDGSAVGLLLEGASAAVPDLHAGDALQAELLRTSVGEGAPLEPDSWKGMNF